MNGGRCFFLIPKWSDQNKVGRIKMKSEFLLPTWNCCILSRSVWLLSAGRLFKCRIATTVFFPTKLRIVDVASWSLFLTVDCRKDVKFGTRELITCFIFTGPRFNIDSLHWHVLEVKTSLSIIFIRYSLAKSILFPSSKKFLCTCRQRVNRIVDSDHTKPVCVTIKSL